MLDDDYNDGSARRGEDATSNFAVKRMEDWVVVRKSIGRKLRGGGCRNRECGSDDDVANHGEEGAHASDRRFRLASQRTRNSQARMHEINCTHRYKI